MAVFGRDNCEGDDDEAPPTLSEISFQFGAADLRSIGGFLLACADEIALREATGRVDWLAGAADSPL